MSSAAADVVTLSHCIACDAAIVVLPRPEGRHPSASCSAPDGAYVVHLCPLCRDRAKAAIAAPARLEVYAALSGGPPLEEDLEEDDDA